MERPEVSDDGRLWAALSYGGMFLGFPISIVPLIQRNDAFALYHARHAMGLFISFMVSFMAIFVVMMPCSFCTFGLANFIFIPLIFLLIVWPMGTSIHGLVLALGNEWQEPIGSFGVGDRLFGNIKLIDHGDGGAAPEVEG